MRAVIFDHVEPPMPTELPLRLTQSCSQRATAVALALLGPVTLGASIAAAWLVTGAMLAPDARAMLQGRPMLAFEILIAVGILFYLVVLPTKRLFDRLAERRIVDIAGGMVTVIEGSGFQSWSWSAPLASYSGVAHHVRASLSGTRHELILVHPDREKSVLLSVAPRTSQSEVDRVAAVLGQREIPPSELYRFKGLWPRMVTQPLPDPSHA
jgi:hypothetical protein